MAKTFKPADEADLTPVTFHPNMAAKPKVKYSMSSVSLSAVIVFTKNVS